MTIQRRLKYQNPFGAIVFAIISILPLTANSFPFSNSAFARITPVLSDSLFNKGMDALISKDTVTAEQLFKASIIENDNPASHVELAKIYLKRNDFNSRDLAYENLRYAVMIDQNKIEYKCLYADICKEFSRVTAFEQYNEILSLDSNQIDAWVNLGILKDQDFTEYNHSIGNMDEFFGSLQDYTDKDFYDAEKYYNRALKIDSLNYEASLKLSLLYEKANLSDKGIPLLMRIVNNKKNDKDIFLSLGLLLYKTKHFKECLDNYTKALKLMNENEREDFVFNSVKLLLQPLPGKESNPISDYELSKIIEQFWRVSDQQDSTDFNERLLAHYSRVAFSNLNFGVPKMGVIGWKSDRGEKVLRFGGSLNLLRIISHEDGGGVVPKTRDWYYKDLTLSGSDPISSSNSQFISSTGEKEKFNSQFSGDAQFYSENINKARSGTIDQEFDKPKFKVDYKISQFKSGEKRNSTDIYINYAMTPIDSLIKDGKFYDSQVAAFFFFNNRNEEKIEKKENVSVFDPNSMITTSRNKHFYTNVLGVSSPADSGFYSFEILRGREKSVSSNRSSINIVQYSNFHLEMSNLLIASRIDKDKPASYCINRGDYNILPNPLNTICAGKPFYIYYELYNLKTDEKNLTDFEQSVDIREYDIKTKTSLEKTFGSVLNFLGIDENDKVGFTSSHQSKENCQQVYFRLDLTGAKPGKYLISINVTDKIDGSNTTASTVIDWTN